VAAALIGFNFRHLTAQITPSRLPAADQKDFGVCPETKHIGKDFFWHLTALFGAMQELVETWACTKPLFSSRRLR
jgi:hypothetical protein